MRVTSSASSMGIFSRMPGRSCASKVLPEPGGPIIRLSCCECFEEIRHLFRRSNRDALPTSQENGLCLNLERQRSQRLLAVAVGDVVSWACHSLSFCELLWRNHAPTTAPGRMPKTANLLRPFIFFKLKRDLSPPILLLARSAFSQIICPVRTHV